VEIYATKQWKSVFLGMALVAAVAIPFKAAACGQSVAQIGTAMTAKGNTSVPFPDISFNVIAVANPLLVVHVDIASGGTVPTVVTYGNQSMTRFTQWGDANAGTRQIWYLVAPQAGPHSVHVGTSGNNVPFNAEVLLFGGVNQSTPMGAVTSGTNNSYTTNYVTNVTTIHSTGLIVDFVSYGTGDNPSVTLGGGQFLGVDFNATPASTVISEQQFGHQGVYFMNYTFQWADVYSAITLELVASCS
jgi:hypothetical protein